MWRVVGKTNADAKLSLDAPGQGGTVPQKTPQKHATKKVGKSLKEKREAKKVKKPGLKALSS